MHKEWLVKKVSVTEAESVHLCKIDRLGPDPIPFGFQNKEWNRFICKMKDGDELWEFNSPPQSWPNMWGRAGYSIVKNGEIIDYFLTLMS